MMEQPGIVLIAGGKTKVTGDLMLAGIAAGGNAHVDGVGHRGVNGTHTVFEFAAAGQILLEIGHVANGLHVLCDGSVGRKYNDSLCHSYCILSFFYR